jgi:hypothetical protein
MKFFFAWIPGNEICHKSVYVLLCKLVHNISICWG